MLRGVLTVVLCAWVVMSQHTGTDGNMWWRVEASAVSVEQCRLLLKAVTGRPKVGMTKWYDVSPLQLEKHFGSPAIPEKGTWLACWPAGTDLGAPDA